MMSNEKFLNIARLMRTYNFEIDHEVLPDNLKCLKCKLVLKDACQVPCGCMFCRCCIDEMMANGDEFCPGVSEECREAILSHFLTVYKENNKISKLIVKCPHNECVYRCSLAEMEDHLRVCPRKKVECPYYEFGCNQAKLYVKEMSEHFEKENLSHNEILIGIIANINKEMKLKDEQIKTILDQIEHLENDNKSIKEEKADAADQVRILSEKIDQIDTEVIDIKAINGSNKDEFRTEIESVRADIQSINQDTKSIKDNIHSIKSDIQLIQALESATSDVDARCDWIIDDDLNKVQWNWGDKASEYFMGAVRPYKYRLGSWNTGSVLRFHLRIHSGPNDSQLTWPFRGKVTITVTNKNYNQLCQTITLQCETSRPLDGSFSCSSDFTFSYTPLATQYSTLSNGVRVSCMIVPSPAGR